MHVEQRLGAGIAREPLYLRKETPGPEHRIASSLLVHGDANGAPIRRREGGDHAVDQACIDLRHVAKEHERAVGGGRNSGQTRLEGCAEALMELRIVDELYAETGKR